MMNSINLGLQKTERTKNQIVQVLEQLTRDYQNIQPERRLIAVNFPASEDEFSILEEIELLTVKIRGYASQIQVRDKIDNPQLAIEDLKNLTIFDIPAIADFYFGSDGEYQRMKVYLQKLDYLQLVMIEYLSFDEIIRE